MDFGWPLFRGGLDEAHRTGTAPDAGLLRGLGFLWGAGGAGWRLALGVMCRGSSVKDHRASDVQLESLILAQNERWRQA